MDEALAMQRSAQREKPRRLGEVLVAMGKVTEEQVQQILEEQQGKGGRVNPADATQTSTCTASAAPCWCLRSRCKSIYQQK